jgi:hypothetical protein
MGSNGFFGMGPPAGSSIVVGPYTEAAPCPTRGSWIPRDSPCDHEPYECSTCGRRQCLRHWNDPLRTRTEALHFLKGAQIQAGQDCFVQEVPPKRTNERALARWKIFTSEADCQHYMRVGKHQR